MASFVIKDYTCSINSVDLSSLVQSITINYEAEVPDATVMSTTGARTKLPGLTNWTVDITFRQDYAASKVDATMFPLVGAAAFPVEFKPTSDAVSATNPKFSGSALLASYQPLAGAVGEVANTTVRLEGTGVLTRATA